MAKRKHTIENCVLPDGHANQCHTRESWDAQLRFTREFAAQHFNDPSFLQPGDTYYGKSKRSKVKHA